MIKIGKLLHRPLMPQGWSLISE